MRGQMSGAVNREKVEDIGKSAPRLGRARVASFKRPTCHTECKASIEQHEVYQVESKVPPRKVCVDPSKSQVLCRESRTAHTRPQPHVSSRNERPNMRQELWGEIKRRMSNKVRRRLLSKVPDSSTCPGGPFNSATSPVCPSTVARNPSKARVSMKLYIDRISAGSGQATVSYRNACFQKVARTFPLDYVKVYNGLHWVLYWYLDRDFVDQ
ncbi:hypothetical protein M436DRAFT_60838 [Aureobasidium namibiae CBS 147.97]|uniref:Uncharacterized protein n=1 Tax=Aureobasidium namibiae CBS 147.97 TaxID=1043004 RepID=A0A074WV60_9PEZI